MFNLRFRPQNFADIFFDFRAGQHHLMAASGTADAKIHAHAQHLKGVGPAWVGLFGLNRVTYTDIHRACSFRFCGGCPVLRMALHFICKKDNHFYYI